MTKAIPFFPEDQLRAICDVLADTSDGLTGSEISRLLDQSGINDPNPGGTKRYRLYDALSARQREDRCANNVVAFIYAAMSPVRFVGRQDRFTLMKDSQTRFWCSQAIN